MDEPLQYLYPAPTATAPAPAALLDSAVVAVGPHLSPDSEAAAVTCPDSPYEEVNSASLGPASAPTAPALAPAHLESDPLLAFSMATASAIQRSPCLKSFLTGQQIPTLPPLPATANHLASPLLEKYAELGCPAAVSLAWPLDTINAAIATGPHAPILT